MPDIIDFPDGGDEARKYLSKFFPNVSYQVPEQWDWSDLLVVVTNSGGTGEYSRFLSETLVTVEVFDPRVATASGTARTALGLLRSWATETPGVYWRGEAGTPAYAPDDETGCPGFIFTVVLAFHGRSVTV